MNPAATRRGASTWSGRAMTRVGGAIVWSMMIAGNSAVGRSGEGRVAGTEIETTYIPAPVNLAVVVRPAALLEQPGFADDPLFADVLGELSVSLGFDVDRIERLTVLGRVEDQNPEPFFGAIVRTAEPLDVEATLAHWAGGAEPVEHDGQTYYVMRVPLPGLLSELSAVSERLSVALPGERTLLLAPEPAIRAMLDAEAASSPLIETLRAADGSRHVVAVLEWRALGEEAARELSQAPDARVRAIAPVFADAEVWSLEADLAPAIDGSLILACRDEEAAARVAEAADAAVEVASDQLDQARQFLGAFPPREQAMVRTLLMLADGALVAAQVEQNADRVVFRTRVEQSGALIISALLPAVQQARTAAERSVCQNNLRQLMLAMHNYHDVHGKFPAAATYDDHGRPLLSWRVELLPYLDQQALYDEFHHDEPWDSPHNRELVERMPDVFACPHAELPAGMTTYLAPIGPDTVFPEGGASSIRDSADGTSNTICFVEAGGERAVAWTQPQDWQLDPVVPTDGLIGQHEGGFHVAMCDGSVRFISENIDKDVLRALFTRRGGEAVSF